MRLQEITILHETERSRAPILPNAGDAVRRKITAVVHRHSRKINSGSRGNLRKPGTLILFIFPKRANHGSIHAVLYDAVDARMWRTGYIIWEIVAARLFDGCFAQRLSGVP